MENPEFWQNFSNTSARILDILRNLNQNPENFGLANPSKIKPTESLFVSIFLYQVSENPSTKNQEILGVGKNRYLFSEHILNYIISVHSDSDTQEMDTIEKILGIIYSNMDMPVSKSVKKAHLRINPTDNAIDVWNKLFPSIPYRQSILLSVQGPGVVYLNPEVKPGMDLNFYDSNRI